MQKFAKKCEELHKNVTFRRFTKSNDFLQIFALIDIEIYAVLRIFANFGVILHFAFTDFSD